MLQGFTEALSGGVSVKSLWFEVDRKFERAALYYGLRDPFLGSRMTDDLRFYFASSKRNAYRSYG
jgi:hypothetical protein